jgi:hypothetical protein
MRNSDLLGFWKMNKFCSSTGNLTCHLLINPQNSCGRLRIYISLDNTYRQFLFSSLPLRKKGKNTKQLVPY